MSEEACPNCNYPLTEAERERQIAEGEERDRKAGVLPGDSVLTVQMKHAARILYEGFGIEKEKA